MKFRFLAAVIAMMSFASVTQSPTVSAAGSDIPEYTQLLPVCTDMGAATAPCHWPDPQNTDSPVVIMVKCDAARSITNYCFDITVNGAPAPATLGLAARMTAYKTHDPTVSNAQYEAMFHMYSIPAGNTLSTSEIWGVGNTPRNQPGNGGVVDLSGVLAATDVVKVTAKFKMHKLPQFNVLIADKGKMDFSLTGNDLTLTMEGSPARVALESASQHINFDMEKNDDPTVAWTDRCGIPSMKFVVCNVDKATSNPLVFYARSSTMVNAPAGDTPGPIWVSTNATYFHFPSVSTDPKGNKQIQVKVAAPHFLADGTTINSGPFRAFLPNDLLKLWGIEKTETALNNALAASIKKLGKEETLDRTFTIGDTGVTITFPNLTYSSPEVYITSVSNLGGSQNANQVYAALLAGSTTSTSSTTSTTVPASTPPATTAPAPPTTGYVAKSVKKGSATTLSKIITPSSGSRLVWSVKGACRISGGKLIAVTAGKTCTVTLKQTNLKTKKTTSKSVVVTVK